ncbi:DUF1501 domain-containing protein [Dokdonia ponticola]|uniref:DUF1501 domain-containing protein n=1 Tax=Dokdonia ponticola TaxID=2041041 RepID=A0ABV9HUR1_9FLAO
MCNHNPHLKDNAQKGQKASKGPSAKITDQHHDQEHTTWSRRSFMQALGLVGTGSIVVGGTNLSAASPSRLTTALANADSDRILVLIRLKGGNDGLNTIVPMYDYDFYAQSRPTIRYQENDLYNLSPDFGIPPSMDPLQSLWGNGQMKVVHGVGYPDSSLSHFRGSDIWASAQPDEIDDTGVFGRYFEDLYPDFLINPPDVPPAIQIGSSGNLIFDGDEAGYAFSVANPQQLEDIAENGVLHDVTNIPDCTFGDQLGFMRSVINTSFTYASTINEAYENASNAVEYGAGQLAKQLAIVARMIKGGLGTQVYLVTLGSFDTHANQLEEHAELLSDLSASVKNFYDDLNSVGMGENVLSMTFSEFGRRIYENGSNGTDHGTASPILMFGDGLNDQGFVGTHPDIQDPDPTGNPAFTTDFRQVYATVLKQWLCIDESLVDQILFGQTYEPLDLGFNCNALGITDVANTSGFQHLATYQGDQTFIEFTMPTTARVTVSLFNLLGQEVGKLKDEYTFEGPQRLNVKQSIRTRLRTGQYVYRISFNGKSYSKSILVR